MHMSLGEASRLMASKCGEGDAVGHLVLMTELIERCDSACRDALQWRFISWWNLGIRGEGWDRRVRHGA